MSARCLAALLTTASAAPAADDNDDFPAMQTDDIPANEPRGERSLQSSEAIGWFDGDRVFVGAEGFDDVTGDGSTESFEGAAQPAGKQVGASADAVHPRDWKSPYAIVVAVAK